jgi:tetratricopeptide (TPR) repeat protein
LLVIIAKDPGRIVEKIELVDHSLIHAKPEKAALYFQRIDLATDTRDDTLPPSVYGDMLRLNLHMKDNRTAAAIAHLLMPDFHNDPRTASMAIRAFDRAGDEAGFTAAIDTALDLCKDDDTALADLVLFLNNRSRSHKVVELFKGMDIGKITHFGLLFQYGRALAEIDPTGEDTINTIERAHDIGNRPQKSARLLSKLYLSVNRNRDALEILDGTGIDAQPESVQAQYADALMANGRYQEAATLYEKLVTDNPHHGGWRRACISALLLGGDEAAAKALYRDDLKGRNLTKYADFNAAVDAIDRNLDTAGIPGFRFDWAYSKLEQLGCAPADRAAWERECKWVNLADHLTLNWLEARVQDADQILPLISGATRARDMLGEKTGDGVGAFIASAHIGGLFAGPFALAKSGLDYRWVASTPMVTDIPGSEFLLSTFSKSKLSLARKIYSAVKDGAVVSIAIDGNSGVESTTVPFLGETIRLSNFIPRAVYQTGASSFFPKVLWIAGRVTVELIPMVMPSPDDTLDGFIDIWFEDFLKHLTDVFRDAPENLRMTGGFWDDVTL